MTSHLIRRDDGNSDGIAGQVFDSYDAAYAVLERYYADVCCSDEREYSRIKPIDQVTTKRVLLMASPVLSVAKRMEAAAPLPSGS